MSENIEVIYQELVYWVADTAPAGWVKTHINMEIEFEEQEIAQSWVITCEMADGQTTTYQASEDKEIELMDLFLELYEYFAAQDEGWSVSDLTVQKNGQYEISYSS